MKIRCSSLAQPNVAEDETFKLRPLIERMPTHDATFKIQRIDWTQSVENPRECFYINHAGHSVTAVHALATSAAL